MDKKLKINKSNRIIYILCDFGKTEIMKYLNIDTQIKLSITCKDMIEPFLFFIQYKNILNEIKFFCKINIASYTKNIVVYRNSNNSTTDHYLYSRIGGDDLNLFKNKILPFLS